MSHENVKIVREFFGASERSLDAYWNNPRSLAAAMEAGELPPETAVAFGFIHPEAVWKTATIGLTVQGHLEMLKGLDQFLEVADDYRATLREVEDIGDDRVLATIDRVAKAKHTGIEMEAPLYSLCTVRDGLIVEMDEYAERTDALEAAALSE